MWAAMHVTSITSHSWHRNFTINQLSEPIKPVYNFRPDERASQCRPRHWTVCGGELKVIMNNSGSNVYKNTKLPFTTEPRRQASNRNVAVWDLFGNPHSCFWNHFTHTDKKLQNINEETPGRSQAWRFTRSQEFHSVLTDYWYLETRKWNPRQRNTFKHPMFHTILKMT